MGGDVLTVETRGRYERGVSRLGGGGSHPRRRGQPVPHPRSRAHEGCTAADRAVDLVVADHGFAGAAIAAGVPTIAVMDTNDPAFAVVAGRGADVTVVPMDDNRPLNVYSTALDVVRRGA